MDTSAEFTYALIEAVRKRPILFSDALNFSKRREQYAAAWVEVAKDLGVEGRPPFKLYTVFLTVLYTF